MLFTYDEFRKARLWSLLDRWVVNPLLVEAIQLLQGTYQHERSQLTHETEQIFRDVPQVGPLGLASS